jgi:hypothetical protein
MSTKRPALSLGLVFICAAFVPLCASFSAFSPLGLRTLRKSESSSLVCSLQDTHRLGKHVVGQATSFSRKSHTVLHVKGTGQVSKWRPPPSPSFEEEDAFFEEDQSEDDAGSRRGNREIDSGRDQDFVVGGGALRGEQEFVSSPRTSRPYFPGAHA